MNMQKMCYNCFAEYPITEGSCPLCGYNNATNAEKYPTALNAGSILDTRYIVGRVLGQGGFGITYLAYDYQLKLKVAIKEYLPDGMATRLPDTTIVSVYVGEKQENFNYGAERFLDEARVLAKFIGNKNIVGVKSYFNENNTSYFVMDYIEGMSFKRYIAQNGGRIDYRDAERVLVPVLRALSVIHGEGFIHRDVTPDNIYITRDDEIKLLDFGSARYSLGDKSKSLDVILKAGYAPKEQYMRRGRQEAYTDVYSLAACFYASITGYLPPEALERMENDELVEISARGIKIPLYLEEAIIKGLEVRAEDRFQSAAEFLAAIEAGQLNDAAPITAHTQPVAEEVPAAEYARMPDISQTPQLQPIAQPITDGYSQERPSVSVERDLNSAQMQIPVPTPQTVDTPVNTSVNTPPQKPLAPPNKKMIGMIAGIAAACVVLVIAIVGIFNSVRKSVDTAGYNPVYSPQSQAEVVTPPIKTLEPTKTPAPTPVPVMYPGTSVPDFGELLSIELMDQDGNEAETARGYRYSVSDFDEDDINLYIELLLDNGFDHTENETIKNLVPQATWLNNDDTYVTMGRSQDYGEQIGLEYEGYDIWVFAQAVINELLLEDDPEQLLLKVKTAVSERVAAKSFNTIDKQKPFSMENGLRVELTDIATLYDENTKLIAVKLIATNLSNNPAMALADYDFVLVAEDPTGSGSDIYYFPEGVRQWNDDTDLSFPIQFGESETLNLTLFYVVSRDAQNHAFVCTNMLNQNETGPVYIYWYADDNVLGQDAANQDASSANAIYGSVYMSVSARLFEKEYAVVDKNALVEAENGVSYKITDTVLKKSTSTENELRITMSVSLTPTSVPLSILDYNFLVLDSNGTSLPDRISISGGDLQKVQQPMMYLYSTTPFDVTLTYLVPAEDTDFTFLESNMFNGEPAGPVYVYTMSNLVSVK